MAVTYNALGSTVTITARSTIVSVGYDNDMALVGGYDANNTGSNFGEAGEVYTLQAASDAADLFGANSELAKQARACFANPVDEIQAIPVPESSETETFSSTSSGTLSETPFNPELNTEHTIEATDTSNSASVDVNIVYEDSPSQPTEEGTMVINPVTGEWAADASSSYEITYDYGEYQTAVEDAADLDVRYVSVLTEQSSLKSDTITELENNATNFDFKRSVVNADPEIDPTSIGSYSPSQTDWRLVEATPALVTSDDGDLIRHAGPVAALAASQPINVEGSILYDDVGGVASHNTEYAPSEAKDFQQVVAVTRDNEVAVAETTSETEEFRDIYANEIADIVVESLNEVSKEYRGGPNLKEDRQDLEGGLQRLLHSFWTQRPALLASGDGTKPYSIDISQGDSDGVTDATIGVEPAPIMEEINLDINFGEVSTFEGVSA